VEFSVLKEWIGNNVPFCRLRLSDPLPRAPPPSRKEFLKVVGQAADVSNSAAAFPCPRSPAMDAAMADLPNWLEPLVEAVTSGITVHGPEGQLGLRYRRVEGVWDVLIYSLPVEMVGGAHDGGLASVGFSLDLRGLLAALTRVDALGWDAHGTCPENSEEGPCVSVEGEISGRKVWVRVLAYAPADVRPAAKVDATGRRRAG
jgi:hypothetical protein